jgi:hypothetical protein
MYAAPGLRRRSLPAALLVVITLVAGILAAPLVVPSAAAAGSPPPSTGALIVNQSFTGATLVDDAWIGLGSTCLTGAPSGSTPSATVNNCALSQSGPVPTIGTTDGYLQLTDTQTRANGTLLYNRALPASAGLSVEFEQYQYGGGGGDGIGFFLVDGATNLT